MGIKTRYRAKPPEDIVASEKLNEPATNAVEAPTDEATLRLQQQLIAIQQAEGFQQLLRVAAHQAASEGHAPDTEAHISRTRQLVDQHLRQSLPTREPTPVPQMTIPPPPPPPPEPPEHSVTVSAPPSRGEVGGYREPSLSSMRLTPDEKDIAARLRITEPEYARRKLEMLRKQRSGEIQQ